MRMPRFPAGMVAVAGALARLGIGHVNVIPRVDEHAARAAELLPLFQKLAVLIEDLDAVVGSVRPRTGGPWNRTPAALRRIELGPDPYPSFPHVVMNFPSLENFTMRALLLPPCPSATKNIAH